METITFKTYSLGCRANQAEMAELAEKLSQEGFISSEKDPNLLLLNSCAITSQAEKDTRKAISKLRRENPKAYLVVLGCAVNAKEKLKINLPKADLLILNKDKESAVQLIKEKFPATSRHFANVKQNKYLNSGRSLLKIQDGCNKFCTYCIVPLLRGKPKNKSASRRTKEIIEEVKILEKGGVKEIILTGINLALYENLTFLLKQILKETKIRRITLSSLTPEIIDQNLINLFAENERLSRFFHLSLQSGSENVLGNMKRDKNLKKLVNFLKDIKEKVPEFTFRADIIVGFPQETEEDFNETLQLIKLAKISFVHAFCFSKRPGTFAFEKIKKGSWQDLPEEIKKERLKKVLEIAQEVRCEEAQKLVGKTLECLVIKKLNNGNFETLASNSWKVLVKGQFKPGEIKRIQITNNSTDSLVGNLEN